MFDVRFEKMHRSQYLADLLVEIHFITYEHGYWGWTRFMCDKVYRYRDNKYARHTPTTKKNDDDGDVPNKAKQQQKNI